jgi:hypothetical protein
MQKSLETQVIRQKWIFVATVLLGVITACAPANPNLVVPNPPIKPSEDLGTHLFEFSSAQRTFEQARFDENIISVFFRAEKEGKSVDDVKASELHVQENGTKVTPFSLGADSEKFEKVADIVFVVDITGTMTAFIESAKKRLKEFINSSRAKNYHTRMCISTFGDYTVKKCTHFFDNNPKDPSTTTQVSELLAELAQLQAYKGEGKDPGWPDLPENSLGALIDASKAPWGPDSQRFVILVTDWGFLSSPDNRGSIGDKAPFMKDVTKAIKDSQIKVFAVTPSKWPGYNSPFQDEPGIVQSSGGEFFEFADVLKGRISLDHVLQRILFNIQTTYKLTYTVEKVAGLNPKTPVAQREIKVSLTDSNRGAVHVKSVLSSMPIGRDPYLQIWKIEGEPIHQKSLRVYIDGKEAGASDFSVNGNEVHFTAVPKPGTQLRFVFFFEAIEKNLRLEPITVKGISNSGNTKVYLNEKEARAEDVIFEQDLEGNTSLRLAPSLMANNDPYEIRKNQSLKVRIVRQPSRF